MSERIIDRICHAIGDAVDEQAFDWQTCLLRLGIDSQEYKTEDEEAALPSPPDGFSVLFEWANHDGWQGVIWVKPRDALGQLLFNRVHPET